MKINRFNGMTISYLRNLFAIDFSSRGNFLSFQNSDTSSSFDLTKNLGLVRGVRRIFRRVGEENADNLIT